MFDLRGSNIRHQYKWKNIGLLIFGISQAVIFSKLMDVILHRQTNSIAYLILEMLVTWLLCLSTGFMLLKLWPGKSYRMFWPYSALVPGQWLKCTAGNPALHEVPTATYLSFLQISWIMIKMYAVKQVSCVHVLSITKSVMHFLWSCLSEMAVTLEKILCSL